MRKSSFIALLIAAIFLLILVPYYLFLKQALGVSILKTLFSRDSIKKIGGETNILILGIPGGSHPGPALSDSIIVANYNFKKNRLITVGIPRDVWSETLKDKINTAYAYAEEKVKGAGLKLAKAEVGAIIGVPIQYGMVINFQEFQDLIDFFGGVDIDVERSFVDKKFPIEGKEDDDCGGKDEEFLCRYKTVSFQKGITHMDGQTALNYVRSRNALGAEGSDFARTKRQQRVFSSVKDKTKEVIWSFNLVNQKKLYENLNELILRDFTNQQAALVFKNIFFKRNFIQKDFSLPREFFIVPDAVYYDGRYVLIPVSGTFDEIHSYFRKITENQSRE